MTIDQFLKNKVWFKIEELIPSEHAIGGKAFWYPLNDEKGMPARYTNEVRAHQDFKAACTPGRNVRLVRVSEKVIITHGSEQ